MNATALEKIPTVLRASYGANFVKRRALLSLRKCTVAELTLHLYGQQIKRDWLCFQEKPWLLEIMEPLKTKAPCPDKAQPYCCYINTVIFYLKPYIVRPWHHLWTCNGKLQAEKPGGHLEEWDRVETELQWDDRVEFNGEIFIIGGGSVVWERSRWWMKSHARRLSEGK